MVIGLGYWVRARDSVMVGMRVKVVQIERFWVRVGVIYINQLDLFKINSDFKYKIRI